MSEEERKYNFMRTHLGMSPDEIAEIEKIPSLTATSLVYKKTYEEETEEQRKVSIAETYLEGLGIKVKTDMYDYYRNAYDILLDLGEYLSKKDAYKIEAINCVYHPVEELHYARCPHCGESYYRENYTTTTAMYCPPIYKNGVNISPDGNKSTTHCTCMNCGKDFSF